MNFNKIIKISLVYITCLTVWAIDKADESFQNGLNKLVVNFTMEARELIFKNVSMGKPNIKSKYFDYKTDIINSQLQGNILVKETRDGIFLNQLGLENPYDAIDDLLLKGQQYSCRYANDIVLLFAIRNLLGKNSFNTLVQKYAKNDFICIASNSSQGPFQRNFLEETQALDPGVFFHFVNLPGQSQQNYFFINLLQDEKMPTKERDLLQAIICDRSFAPKSLWSGENGLVIEKDKIWGHGLENHQSFDQLSETLLGAYYDDLKNDKAVENLKQDGELDLLLKDNGYIVCDYKDSVIKRDRLLTLSKLNFIRIFMPLLNYSQKLYREIHKYDQLSWDKLIKSNDISQDTKWTILTMVRLMNGAEIELALEAKTFLQKNKVLKQ